jgi:hypothetical protein
VGALGGMMRAAAWEALFHHPVFTLEIIVNSPCNPLGFSSMRSSHRRKKVMNVTIFCTHPTQTSDVIVNPKNPVNPDSKFQFQENGPQNITSAAQLISNNGQKKKNPVNPDSKPFYSITKVATAPASSAIGK